MAPSALHFRFPSEVTLLVCPERFLAQRRVEVLQRPFSLLWWCGRRCPHKTTIRRLPLPFQIPNFLLTNDPPHSRLLEGSGEAELFPFFFRLQSPFDGAVTS